MAESINKSSSIPRIDVQQRLGLPELKTDGETMVAIGDILLVKDASVMRGVLTDEFLMTDPEIDALDIPVIKETPINAENTPLIVGYLLDTKVTRKPEISLRNALVKNLMVLAVEDHTSPLKRPLNIKLNSTASTLLDQACEGNSQKASEIRAIISEDPTKMKFGELKGAAMGNHVQQLTYDQRKAVERAMEADWKEHSLKATKSVWSLIRLYKETLGFKTMDQVVQALGYSSTEALQQEMRGYQENTREEYAGVLAQDGIQTNFANPTMDTTYWDAYHAKNLKGGVSEDDETDNLPDNTASPEEQIRAEFNDVAKILGAEADVNKGRIAFAAAAREGKDDHPSTISISTPTGFRTIIGVYPTISPETREDTRSMLAHELTHCKERTITEDRIGQGPLAFYGSTEADSEAMAMLVERQFIGKSEGTGKFKGDSQEAVRSVRQAVLADWMVTAMQRLFELHDKYGARDLTKKETTQVNAELGDSYESDMSQGMGVYVGPDRWAYELVDLGMPQSAVYPSADSTLVKLEKRFESKYGPKWIDNAEALKEVDVILGGMAMSPVMDILDTLS